VKQLTKGTGTGAMEKVVLFTVSKNIHPSRRKCNVKDRTLLFREMGKVF